MRVMITDGGPHAPEKWAIETARALTPIDDKMEPAKQIAAERLRASIAEALIPHHAKVRQTERSHLKAVGVDHLFSGVEADGSIDASEHVEDALERVVACAAGTPWEAQYADHEVQGAIASVLHSHFATSMDVERLWHVDRHIAGDGNDPKALAYRALRHTEA